MKISLEKRNQDLNDLKNVLKTGQNTICLSYDIKGSVNNNRTSYSVQYHIYNHTAKSTI